MGDLILGIILLIALLDGYRRGVIKLLGSFGGALIGVFVARRLTPHLLLWLQGQFDLLLVDAAQGGPAAELLAGWFFANTMLGRLLELAVFVALTAAVTWLVRFLVNALGSVVNATPLVGFVSRALGAALELLIYCAALYFIYMWFMPWLVGVAPAAAPVNSIFASSQYVLRLVEELGGLIWYSAVDAVLWAGGSITS